MQTRMLPMTVPRMMDRHTTQMMILERVDRGLPSTGGAAWILLMLLLLMLLLETPTREAIVVDTTSSDKNPPPTPNSSDDDDDDTEAAAAATAANKVEVMLPLPVELKLSVNDEEEVSN